MKKNFLAIVFTIFFVSMSGLAFAVPDSALDDSSSRAPVQDTQTIVYINQQHDKTRQFIQSEFDNGIEEFTVRADYYESSFQRITNGAILKIVFGLLGVMLFVSSLNYALRLRSERRKYQVMKESIYKDICDDVRKQFIILPKEVEEKLDYIVAEEKKKKGEPIEKTFMQKIDNMVFEKKGKPKKRSLFKRLFAKGGNL